MSAVGLGQADLQQSTHSIGAANGSLAAKGTEDGSAALSEREEVSAGDAAVEGDGRTRDGAGQSLARSSTPPSTTPYPAPVASTSTSTPSPSSASKPSATPVLASPAPRKISLLRRPSVSSGAETQAVERVERNGVDEVARRAAKLSLGAAEPSPTSEQDVGGDELQPLDKVLHDGLQNPRDRLLLLRAEVEMERFVANTSCVSSSHRTSFADCRADVTLPQRHPPSSRTSTLPARTQLIPTAAHSPSRRHVRHHTRSGGCTTDDVERRHDQPCDRPTSRGGRARQGRGDDRVRVRHSLQRRYYH